MFRLRFRITVKVLVWVEFMIGVNLMVTVGVSFEFGAKL